MEAIHNKFWDGSDCSFLRCFSGESGEYVDVRITNVNMGTADGIIENARELTGYGICQSYRPECNAAVIVSVENNVVTKAHRILVGVIKGISGTAFEFDEMTLNVIGVAKDIYQIHNSLLPDKNIDVIRDKLNV